MAYFYLEIILGVEKGRRHHLPDGAISIGRSLQNSIVISAAEKSVSSHHLIIYKSPERTMVQDLQSTNGTYVNEVKIVEQDLVPGNELGFGKNGPRLRLISSETELSTKPGDEPDGQGAGTQDDTISPFMKKTSKEALRNEQGPQNDFAMDVDKSEPASKKGPSPTMEFGRKLEDRNISSGDLQKLMKDGKRLERVLEQADLGPTQVGMLRTMYDANRGTRRKWLWIVFAIMAVSVAVVSIIAVRAYQYRQIIVKARTLRNDIAEYDKRIAQVNSNPDANKEEIERLVNELEAKEKTFSTLQPKIAQDDYGKFYSDPLEKDIDHILQQFGESDYHIPREMIERVKYHSKLYSGTLHNTIAHYLKRRDKYLPMIQKTLREKKLPVELAYVAMLESGFNSMALSSAGARGLWQLMPATGVRFKLTVNGDIDERTDPVKATEAASQYFRELIGMFGGKSSVMLCMAAYNAGEGRILNALRKIEDPMRNRDFWYMYRMGYLAEETNEYIPRVIALMIISEHPQQYGFSPAEQVDTGNLESANDFVEVGPLNN
jgi:pSer/pThr/pTyr-binding forkhead associated (FHA) protein